MQNQELLNQKKIVDKFLTEVYSKEKEEIDSWNMSTPRLVDFKPSKELISLIKGVCSGRFNKPNSNPPTLSGDVGASRRYSVC